ncbi:hypothetical protein BDW74DRAFT_179983 [Aspergillus multicolor]|uniref:uncharacterized protein n=1 Tax=Aspergillus multicolor TaxID=41759 RepID=UPI003CCCF189
MAAAQEQTIPKTVTVCPRCFTTNVNSPALGDTQPDVGLGVDKILPRSINVLHELFHLMIGNPDTDDAAYNWKQQQDRLNDPDTTDDDKFKPNLQLIRENPESYAWFTVGYWYFQQTNRQGWNVASNRRWSFQSGVGELIQI